MNVLNVELVEEFCSGLAALVAGSPRAQTWLRSNLRNHVLREPVYHVAVADGEALAGAVARGLVDAPPDWLPKASARGDRVVAFDPASPGSVALEASVLRMFDWLRAADGAGDWDALARASVEDALAASEAWLLAKARQRVALFAARAGVTERAAAALLSARDPAVSALWPDDAGGVAACAAFPDLGLRIVRLASRRALEREGVLLDHCVETYWDAVAAGECEIYSVRDADNLPLATVETAACAPGDGDEMDGFAAAYVAEGTRVVRQVQGRSNGPAPERVRAPVAEFLAGLGVAVASRPQAAWLAGRIPGVADLVAVDRLLVDLPRLAAADPQPPWDRPGAALLRAVSLLASRRGGMPPEAGAALLALFLPPPDCVGIAREDRRLGAETVSRVTVRVPTGAFSAAAASVRDAFPDAVAAAFGRVADSVVAVVAAGEGGVHDVVFTTPGAFATPDVFFAYAGRLAEWAAARAAASAAARAHLTAVSARLKSALGRDRRLPQDERDRLLKAVNTLIPALLGAGSGGGQGGRVAPRPAPAAPTPTLKRLLARAGKSAAPPRYR